MTIRKRAHPDDSGQLSERLLTNKAFTYALRNGKGLLTRVQRVALFLFGCILLAAGVMSLVASFIMPARMRPDFTSDIFYYVSSTIMLLIAILVGCAGLALGLRTLRHVIWRAGRTER